MVPAVHPVSAARLVTSAAQPGSAGSSSEICAESSALSSSTSIRRPVNHSW